MSKTKSISFPAPRKDKCAESGDAVVAKDNLYKLDVNCNKRALEILKEIKTR